MVMIPFRLPQTVNLVSEPTASADFSLIDDFDDFGDFDLDSSFVKGNSVCFLFIFLKF